MLDDAVAVRATEATEPAGPRSAGGRTATLVRRTLGSVWLAPTALTGVACFARIGRPELWQDELVTLMVAVRPRSRIVDLVHNVDAVHAAYYLSIHMWVQVFGTSEAALRAPSALAMTLAAGFVALAGKRLFTPAAGLLAGLVFAIVPSITRFGQEARSYGFVVLTAAVATVCVLRAIERPTVFRWLWYALCVTALILFNTVAVTIVIGHFVGVLVSMRTWRNLRAWRVPLSFCVAVLLGAAPTIGVVALGMEQATRQVLWIPHDPPWRVWPRVFASTGVAFAVSLLAVVAVVRLRRKAAFAAVVAAVPPALVALASLGELSYFFSKYLLFVVPIWAVLAGAGLACLPWKASPYVGLAVVAALAVPGQVDMRGDLSHSWYTYPDAPARRPLAYSDAARIIAAGYRPGDGVVYQRGRFWWTLTDVGVAYHLPKNVRPHDIFVYHRAADIDLLISDECPVPADCIHDEPRIWVVVPNVTDNPLGELDPAQVAALRAHYELRSVQHPTGMSVGLLERVK